METINKKHTIGLIGLGKMGGGIALQMKDKGWDVAVFNRTSAITDEYTKNGTRGFYSIKELVNSLPKPRVVWVMLTAGEPTQETILGENGLVTLLDKNDIVIDAANSFYKHSEERYKVLKEKGIHFIDAGVSGGPDGARNGACIMVGGDEVIADFLSPLFSDLCVENGYDYFGEAGAGHFVKMVHNGIEYGMMQAIGEGFEVMRKSKFNLDLKKVAKLYNHGSVIESRLINWLYEGYERYGVDLKDVSGSVAHTGEGLWTVETAKELGVDVAVIEESLEFRRKSEQNPSYVGKVVSVLRNMFGKHDVSQK